MGSYLSFSGSVILDSSKEESACFEFTTQIKIREDATMTVSAFLILIQYGLIDCPWTFLVLCKIHTGYMQRKNGGIWSEGNMCEKCYWGCD